MKFSCLLTSLPFVAVTGSLLRRRSTRQWRGPEETWRLPMLRKLQRTFSRTLRDSSIIMTDTTIIYTVWM